MVHVSLNRVNRRNIITPINYRHVFLHATRSFLIIIDIARLLKHIPCARNNPGDKHALINQINFVEVVNTQQMLQISNCLCAHAVSYEMDLAGTGPAAGNAIRIPKGQSLLATLHDLPQHDGMIHLLMRMLLNKVLVAVDSSDQPGSAVTVSEASPPTHLIYAHELLVQLACPIVDRAKTAGGRDEEIVALAQRTIPEKVLEVGPKHRGLVLHSIAHTVYEDNRVVIVPLLLGQGPKFLRPF